MNLYTTNSWKGLARAFGIKVTFETLDQIKEVKIGRDQ